MTGCTGSCVGFGVAEIGFVLRKKGTICRGVSTSVEGRRGKATDLGVVGVGECLGLGSYDENLVLWYLLLTIWYLLLRTDYLLFAIGYSLLDIC
jgi:hypothetical protein